MSRANSRWPLSQVKRIQMILCRCFHSSSQGTPFAGTAFDWRSVRSIIFLNINNNLPPSIIKIVQINAHFNLNFRYLLQISCLILNRYCWMVDLIYAKSSNIRFEISLAPHLISIFNQALFYTHLTLGDGGTFIWETF